MTDKTFVHEGRTYRQVSSDAGVDVWEVAPDDRSPLAARCNVNTTTPYVDIHAYIVSTLAREEGLLRAQQNVDVAVQDFEHGETSLADAVARAAKLLNMSQAEMARALRVSPSSVNHLLVGRTARSDSIRAKLIALVAERQNDLAAAMQELAAIGEALRAQHLAAAEGKLKSAAQELRRMNG